MAAPVNAVPNPPQYDPAWMPPQTERWSNPPVITDEKSATMTDNAIRLRQGIVCEVVLAAEWLFQNVNNNENEVVEFSLHGDPDGIWGKMNPRSFVRARTTVYFLNRQHQDVLYLATFKQNTA